MFTALIAYWYKIQKKQITHQNLSTNYTKAILLYLFQQKSAKSSHTVYNAYSQSWVFDTDNASSSNHTDSPYLKLKNGGTPKKQPKTELQNGMVNDTAHLIDNPVVHIEEASDDSTSNSDRKLCYMKSFSRSTSPVVLSASSSQLSLNDSTSNNPQIYECLEKLTDPTIYRSRLDSALSNKEEEQLYQAPHVAPHRVEPVSPNVEKVQYASLMKELQRALISKKEPNITSPQSASNSTTSEKTQNNSKNSSRHESSRSDGKNSDVEFSKELEAALQLIQDLESPNTIETPSDAKSDSKEPRPLAVWRNSDASESEKTLSAVGSLAEITSPLTECQPELYSFKPSANGKGACVVVQYNGDSQSTSGYSSPTHAHTPNWSAASSVNGSNNEIIKPLSYSIHNTKSTAVISLYSPESTLSKGKSVTLVKISGENVPLYLKPNDHVHNSKVLSDLANNNYLDAKRGSKSSSDSNPKTEQQRRASLGTPVRKVKSLLRKKKQSPPRLCPELEGAIIKSESLAHLTKLELLARHQRNKEIQRVRIREAGAG